MSLSETSELISLNNINGGSLLEKGSIGDKVFKGYTTQRMMGLASTITCICGLCAFFGMAQEMKSRKYTEESVGTIDKVDCIEQTVTKKSRDRRNSSERTYKVYNCKYELSYKTNNGIETIIRRQNDLSTKPIDGTEIEIYYNPSKPKDIAENVSPQGQGLSMSSFAIFCCIYSLFLLYQCFNNETCFNMFGVSQAVNDVGNLLGRDRRRSSYDYDYY